MRSPARIGPDTIVPGYPDRMGGRANHHSVLQDGRVVADAHRSAMRPHHQALRQDRARTDVDLTQHHRGAGYLGLGFVSEKLVEAHAASPSFWPAGPSSHVLSADFRTATSAPLGPDWVSLLPGVLPGLRSFFQGRYRRRTWLDEHHYL